MKPRMAPIACLMICGALLTACAAPSATQPTQNAEQTPGVITQAPEMPTDTTDPSPESSDPPVPSQSPSTVPERFSLSDNTIAGLTMGASTDAEVLEKLGQAVSDTTDGVSKIRNLQFDGIQVLLNTQTNRLISLYVTSGDAVGPRGITIGMTREALENAFPRLMPGDVTEGGAEYLYAEGLADDAPEGMDGYYPPMAYIQYDSNTHNSGVYTYMVPLGEVKPSFAYTREPQLMLTVSFANDRVTVFGMTYDMTRGA